MAQLKVGAKAPAFSLHDQSDTRVRLADFKGRPVVVYFYPKADTPGSRGQGPERRRRPAWASTGG